MTGMPHAAPAYRYIQALLPCTLKLTALGVIPLEPEPLAFLGLVALRVVEEKSLGDVVEGRVGLRLLLRITCFCDCQVGRRCFRTVQLATTAIHKLSNENVCLHWRSRYNGTRARMGSTLLQKFNSILHK